MNPTLAPIWNTIEEAVASRAAGGAGRDRYEQRITPPLRFQFENDRLTGMPVLGVLYPSVTLAEVGDPWELARAVEEEIQLRMDIARGK